MLQDFQSSATESVKFKHMHIFCFSDDTDFSSRNKWRYLQVMFIVSLCVRQNIRNKLQENENKVKLAWLYFLEINYWSLENSNVVCICFFCWKTLGHSIEGKDLHLLFSKFWDYFWNKIKSFQDEVKHISWFSSAFEANGEDRRLCHSKDPHFIHLSKELVYQGEESTGWLSTFSITLVND